jgi:type I restriction enzyme S subunit
MRERWPNVKLGQYCTFRNGLNFTQQDSGHTVKVVGVSDFWKCNVLHDFSTIPYVSLSAPPTSDDLLMDGDLLFVRSNGNKDLVGRCMLVFPGLEDVSFSGFTIRGRLNQAEFDPYFVGYVFQSDLFRQHLMREGAGTNISNLNQEMLARFIMPKPPLVEQQRVTELLRSWDTAIEQSAKLLALVQKRNRGIQQTLFNPKAVSSSGWKVARLSELTDRVRRKTDGGQHAVMTISGKTGFLRQDERFSRFMAGESLENYTLLKKGEFSYNKGNSYTYPQGCIYRLEQLSALVPNVYISFRLHDNLNAEFYAALFQAGYLNQQLARLINSGVRNNGLLNLSPDSFFTCEVPVPLDQEQTHMAELLRTTVRQISAIDREIALLRMQKRGVMQKLLKGKWPLSPSDNESNALPTPVSAEAAQ